MEAMENDHSKGRQAKHLVYARLWNHLSATSNGKPVVVSAEVRKCPRAPTRERDGIIIRRGDCDGNPDLACEY